MVSTRSVRDPQGDNFSKEQTANQEAQVQGWPGLHSKFHIIWTTEQDTASKTKNKKIRLAADFCVSDTGKRIKRAEAISDA